MAKILIVGEIKDGKLRGNAAELAAAANALGGEVHGALLGSGSTAAAQGLAQYGISAALVLDGDLPAYSSDGFAAALIPAVQAGGYDYVLLQHSFFGRDLAARLAAGLGAGYLNDVTAISAGPVFAKPLYAGKVVSQMEFRSSGVKVVTIRPKVFMPAEASGSGSVAVTALNAPASYRSKVTSVLAKDEGLIDVKDADIIITGGRGVGGPEGFAPLREFARAVGCALGASRAAVDAGWIDHSHQVGQTGKTVTPRLYIACGVSGAIQHLAGMQTSKTIVAINSSDSAPLLKIADYSIVGDLFEIVPELQKQILELRAQG